MTAFADNTPIGRSEQPEQDSNWQRIGDVAKRLAEEAQRKRDEAGQK